ncbi:MAG: SDR family oxidoreductase [Gammaproteobacteria bacterium]|nr:MAG: SDR family oxidoreductase [Gammaproteobacteria bacterium]
MTDGILLFGGTGRTGFEIAKLLAGRAEQVTAFVRPDKDASALEALGITIVRGDARDSEPVNAAFASDRFRAVISTIGARRGEPGPRADDEGIVCIVDAAKKHGVQRLLMVTMIGAGDSKSAVSAKVIEFLGDAIIAKTRAENYLVGSGLEYTILRPGGLSSDAGTGTGVLTEDHSLMGVIRTADLGRLVVECLDDDSTVGHIYHATDPEIKQQAPLQRGENLPKKR